MSSENRNPENQSDGGEDSDEVTLLPHQYAPWDYCEKPNANNSQLRNIITAPDLFTAENRNDRNIYHLILKAIKFYPESVTVKQNGRSITFECKQAERCVDGCWMSSVVVRRIVVPDSVNLRFLETRISNDYTLSVLGVIMPKPRRNVPITVNVRPVAQQPQYPRNVVREPRMYDLQTSQRLMEAAYRSMAAPGYSYWSMYPDNCVDTLSHLQMQYGCKPTPKARAQGQRQVRRQNQSQDYTQGHLQGYSQGNPQDQYQGQQQDQSRAYPRSQSQDYSQGYSQDYPQSHSQGYSHAYSQGHPQDYSRGYSQGHTQDYQQGQSQNYQQDTSRGYPQVHSQGHPQCYVHVYSDGFPQAQAQVYQREYSDGYPQGQTQVNPRDHPQRPKQGYSQEYSQGYQQSHTQGRAQGYAQGLSQGNLQGYPQGRSQGYPQSHRQENLQGRSQGYAQGNPQDYPQGRSQAPPPNQQRAPMGNGNPPGMQSARLSPLRELSPADSYEMLSAPSEDDDVETDYCSKNCSD